MESPWACAVDRAKRFFLSFHRPPPPHADPNPNPIDILKRLQREAFHDIMQLRERQEKVEKVLSLFKTTKAGPFAEESTRVKGVINIAGTLARDGAEADSGISSGFVFQTAIRQKKDSLSAELVADRRYTFQDDEHIGSPLVLSKVMYLSNLSDSFSVAAVPVGARCDDFSTDLNLREERWLASLRSSLRPPLLIKSHKYGAGLILRSKDFSASLARLISGAGKHVNSGEAGKVFTGFGQMSYQMAHDIKMTVSAALHGPCLFPRTRKSTSGGCIDFELKVDEDSRIGAWIEVNNKSNSRSLRWALTLSDTPEDDLGWGVTLRRCTEAKPQRFQVEGFLNLHLGKKAALQPGIVFNLDGGTCTPALVFRSSWSL